MATLTSTKIKNTYDALLKSIDNDAIGTTAKQITDGLGNVTPLYISTTQVGIGVTPEAGLNLHVFGDAKIGSNLTVIGNLVVEGSTTTVGTDTLTVKDPLIVLANNNTSTDAVDIGFYGKYTPSGTTLYSGLFREALTGKYRLFKGLETEPTTTVNTSGTGYAQATLIASLEGNVTGNLTGNVTGGTISGTTGTFSGNVDIDGTLDVDDVISVEGSAFGRIEIGGASGGYIDLKAPNSDDYDLRIITSSGGNEVTTATGDLIFNTAETLALTIDTSQDATFQGDIILSGTVDGRDVATDGAKLDGIEGSADVTDATNVLAAGAVMTTGNQSIGGVKTFSDQVTIPATPSASTDAASKGYVDSQVGDNNELSEVLANGNTTGGTDIAVSAGDDITFVDDSKAIFGSDGDLEIYHYSITDIAQITINGELDIRANTLSLKSYVGETMLRGSSNGAVRLYYDGVEKFITTSTGISVTGGVLDMGQNRIDGSTDNLKISADNSSVSGSSTIEFLVDGSEKMRINNSGNVGIGTGTDSPAAKLEITTLRESGIRLSSSDITAVGDELLSGIDFYSPDTGNEGIKASIKVNYADTAANSYMTFSTGANTERMRIDSSGNLLLGNGVGNPYLSFLSAGGNGGNERARIFGYADGGTYGGGLEIQTRDSLNIFQNRMRIDSSGNVNITSGDLIVPEYIKHSGDTNNNIRFQAGRMILQSKASASAKIDLHDNGSLFLNSGGGTALTLDTSQNATFAGNVTVNSPQGGVNIHHKSAGNGGFDKYSSVDDGIYGYIGTGSHLLSPVINDNDFVLRAQGEFAVSIAAAEKFRIDSSGNATFAGNVGIGIDFPSFPLEVDGGSGDGIKIKAGNSSNDDSFLVANNADSTLFLVDGGGNVGIGTDLPSTKTEIKETNNDIYQLTLYNSHLSTTSKARIGNWNSDIKISSNYMQSGGTKTQDDASLASWVQAMGAEADSFDISRSPAGSTTLSSLMRITSGGSLLVGGQTSTVYTEKFSIENTTASQGIVINQTDNANANDKIIFQNTNGVVGYIRTTGSATSYTTSSDYRLKENLQDFEGLDIVSKIPVYDFKWKTDESRSYGVMAHELQEVLPDAVSGEKDAEEMQGVDYSKIVPLLVKSIQELKAEVDLLKQECKCKN